MFYISLHGFTDFYGMETFIENKLNHYAENIIKGNNRRDEYSLGELNFYISLRRVLEGNATMEDAGLMDAINDTLVETGFLQEGQVFYDPQ